MRCNFQDIIINFIIDDLYLQLYLLYTDTPNIITKLKEWPNHIPMYW